MWGVSQVGGVVEGGTNDASGSGDWAVLMEKKVSYLRDGSGGFFGRERKSPLVNSHCGVLCAHCSLSHPAQLPL